MQGGDHLWNAATATMLDMDWLSLSSLNQDSGTNLSTIGCLSSDDGSSTIGWSIYCPTNATDDISIDTSTDADADWATYIDNDWAATEGGGLNLCLLKPPACGGHTNAQASLSTSHSAHRHRCCCQGYTVSQAYQGPIQQQALSKNDCSCECKPPHISITKNYQKIIFNGGQFVMLHSGRQEHSCFQVPCC